MPKTNAARPEDQARDADAELRDARTRLAMSLMDVPEKIRRPVGPASEVAYQAIRTLLDAVLSHPVLAAEIERDRVEQARRAEAHVKAEQEKREAELARVGRERDEEAASDAAAEVMAGCRAKRTQTTRGHEWRELTPEQAGERLWGFPPEDEAVFTDGVRTLHVTVDGEFLWSSPDLDDGENSVQGRDVELEARCMAEAAAIARARFGDRWGKPFVEDLENKAEALERALAKVRAELAARSAR